MKVGLLSMGRVCLSNGVLVAERGFYRKGSIFIVFWMDIRKILVPLWLRFRRGLSLLSLNNSQSSKKESVRASKLLPISSFLPFFSVWYTISLSENLQSNEFSVDLKFVLIWLHPTFLHGCHFNKVSKLYLDMYSKWHL